MARLEASVAKECIENNSDIVNFGSSADAVDGSWIEKAEEVLGVKLPESYVWFLRNYRGGEIAGEELYSIYGMDFEDVNGGDIVFQHLVNTKNNLTKSNQVVVCETDFDEVFYFDYSQYDGKECPIFIRYPSGNNELYADNFYEFIVKRIEANS